MTKISHASPQSKPASQKEGDNRSGAPFMKKPSPSAFISSSFSFSGPCHRCPSFLTSACSFLLYRRPISFSVGWSVCFWRFVYGGKEYPAGLGRLSSFSSSRGTWQPSFSLVPRWAASPVPAGSLNFSASFSPSWTSLQDSGSILCAQANTACFRLCTQTLYNFAVVQGLRLYTNSVREEWRFLWMQPFLFFLFFFPTHKGCCDWHVRRNNVKSDRQPVVLAVLMTQCNYVLT